MTSQLSFQRYSLGLILFTILVLSLPLVAMQFTTEVSWTFSDFAIMGGLIITTGLAYRLLTRNTTSGRFKLAIGLFLGTLFLLIWAQGAVGIF